MAAVPTDPRPEQEYLQFLREGRFMLQRSQSSGRYVFYPRIAEPGTGTTDLEWVEASGNGVVHATTVVRKRPPEPPYNVALVDLEEGVRMMTRVEGIDPEQVRIGMAVRAQVQGEGDDAIVVFRPVQDGDVA